MNNFKFSKYSGTGNDFVILDNRDEVFDMSDKAFWAHICDRKEGIGADGVLFLCKSAEYDYKMVYLNADGGEVSMCGNGSRCLAHFAYHVAGMNKGVSFKFETMNGVYEAELNSDFVKVLMSELYDVDKIQINDLYESDYSIYMNTGVPHCVFEEENLEEMNLMESGAEIRHDPRFENGANANFFKVVKEGEIDLRTFERGVEGETLACGTGATAAALACSKFFNWKDSVIVHMPGGDLVIDFNEDHSRVFLGGKVKKIFSGVFN